MMAMLSIGTILERVQELKHESQEKDEVIRAQQIQLNELETKSEALENHYRELADKAESMESRCRELKEWAETLEAQNRELQDKVDELGEAAAQADELIERITQLLG